MKINLTIPVAWNELSVWQLKQIANLFHSDIRGVLFDFKALSILINHRWWHFWKHWKLNQVIHHTTFKSIKQEYSWVYNELSLTTFIPSVKIREKWYSLKKTEFYAPHDRINNLTVEEFASADDLFLGFLHSKSFEYLQHLAAVLYREVDANGKRVAYDKNELTKRAKLFKKVNRKTLLSMLMSYQGSRTYIESKFPFVFPKSQAKKKKGRKPPRSSGFGKIVLHVAGGKFGTYNETKGTNVYDFLTQFENELKAEKKRNKKK